MKRVVVVVRGGSSSGEGGGGAVAASTAVLAQPKPAAEMPKPAPRAPAPKPKPRPEPVATAGVPAPAPRGSVEDGFQIQGVTPSDSGARVNLILGAVFLVAAVPLYLVLQDQAYAGWVVGGAATLGLGNLAVGLIRK